MAAPTTEILDTFDRADENPLAGNWTQPIGVDEGVNLRLVSQQVLNGAEFDVCSAYWNPTTFSANQEAYITIKAFDSSPGTRIYVRITDPAGVNLCGYYCTYIGIAGTISIGRLDDGVPTVLGSQIVGSNYTKIWLLASGTTLIAYGYHTESGWTELLSKTDATYNQAGYIGFGINSSSNAPGVRLDDFGGGGADIAITAVTISGDTSVTANANLALIATPTPTGSTLPITYTWSSTGLQSGQGTSAVTYQFGSAYAGTSLTISLTATNSGGAYTATDTHSVGIYDTLARAHVCALVDSVTNAGNVYCYKRHFVLREKLVELFQYGSVLRGFDMELRSVAEERTQFGTGLLRTYNFNIFGYFAWQDPDADPAHTTGAPSEETTGAIVLEVVNALDNAQTLHDSDYHFNCSKAQVIAIEPWVWCNELVHRATITLAVIDYVNQ